MATQYEYNEDITERYVSADPEWADREDEIRT